MSPSAPAAADRRWIAVAVIGAALSLLGMALAGPAFQTHEAHYTHGGGAFQLAFGADALARLFAEWQVPIPGTTETGLTLNRQVLYPGDTLLPLGYGLFYLALLTLLSAGAGARWRSIIDRARWLPMVGLVFDLLENAGMAHALALALAGEAVPGWVPLTFGACGVVKYASVSVLTPVVGLGLVGHRWGRPDRSAVRLVLAGIALAVPVAFVVKSGWEAVAFHLG